MTSTNSGSPRTRHQTRHLHRRPLLGFNRASLCRLHARRRLRLATILLRRNRFRWCSLPAGLHLRGRERIQAKATSLASTNILTSLGHLRRAKSLRWPFRCREGRAHRLVGAPDRLTDCSRSTATAPHFPANPQALECHRPRSGSVHDCRPLFHLPARAIGPLDNRQLWHLHRSRSAGVQLHLPHPHRPTTLQLGSSKSPLPGPTNLSTKEHSTTNPLPPSKTPASSPSAT